MKFREFLSTAAVALLAIVSLLAVPALSWSGDYHPGGIFQWPMFCMKNNITGEELDNMTLGELKEIQRQARNDTTAGNASACSLHGKSQNGKEGCEMPGSCKMNRMGPIMVAKMNGGWHGSSYLREYPGGYRLAGEQRCRDAKGCNRSEIKCAFQQDKECSRCDMALEIISEVSPVLLMDNLTADDLQNMTLNEIRSLVQEKTRELDNMTLFEVRQIEKTKFSERENMTLFDLKNENRNMRRMSRIIEWVRSEHHFWA